MKTSRLFFAATMAISSVMPLTAWAAYSDADSSFGQNGQTTLTSSAYDNAFAIQQVSPSGNLYGLAFNASGALNALFRLTPSGHLDTSFGTSGYLAISNPNTGSIDGLAVDEAHNLAYVYFHNGSSSPVNCIIRISLTTGALDTSYGINGVVTLSMFPTSSETYQLVLQPDGKLIVGGDTYPSNRAIVVTRLLTTGSVDSGFASPTQNVASIPDTNAQVGGIALDGQGNILIAGRSSSTSGLFRLSAAGILDTSFGTSGVVSNSSFSEFFVPFVKANGTIVVQGLATGSDNQFSLLEYQTTGALLNTFGTNGVQSIGALSTGSDYSRQTDGKILIDGQSCTAGACSITVNRYLGSPEYVSTVSTGNGSTTIVTGSGNSGSTTLTSNTGTINNAQAVSQPAGAPATDQYPAGWYAFTINGIPNGGTVTLTMTVPGGTTPNAYVKCNANGSSCSAYPNASFNGNTVTLTLTDGGPGDADGVANGVIVDPGAPAIAPASTSSSGGGALGLGLLFPMLSLGMWRRRQKLYRKLAVGHKSRTEVDPI